MLWDFGVDVINWGWSATNGWVSDGVNGAFADALTMLSMWVLDAVSTMLTMVLRSTDLWRAGQTGWSAQAIDSGSGSFLETPWFLAAIDAMQSIGLWTAALALIVGVTTAAWSLSGALILRRLSTQVLKWYFLTFFLVTLTSTAMQVFDGMETFFVQSALGESTGQLFGGLTGLNAAASESGALSSLVVTLVSMVLVVLSLVVMLVLHIRDAALALVLLFAPLVSGLLMTPYAQAIGTYLNKVAALVMLKFVLIASITLGSAAMVSVGGVGGGAASVLALSPAEPPQVLTADGAELQHQQVTAVEQQAVGAMVRDLMAGTAVLGLSLFSPSFVSSILPVAGGDTHADRGQVIARSAGDAARRGRRSPPRR